MAKKAAKKSAKKKVTLQVDIPKIRKNLQEKCKLENLPVISPPGSYEVCEKTPVEVAASIKNVFQGIYQQIQAGTWPSIEIPLRRRENIIYDDRGNLFFGSKKQKLCYDGEYPDFLHTLRAAQIVNELVARNVHSTKREVFYCDVNLYREQRNSDKAIENVATLLGTRRKCLNVEASPKGTCIGRLLLKENNHIINCDDLGSGGWCISSLLDQVELVETDAEFILVVEKDAGVIRLTEKRFLKYVPCIIITPKGQPDMATHEFVRRLVDTFHIPAIGLCDSDPYGLDILMKFAHGSVQTAHETPRLAINDFWWLGVHPTDLVTYKIGEQFRIPMNKEDECRAKYMLREPRIKQNIAVQQQLKRMLESSWKAEIQSLSSRGYEFFVQYLIEKLETGDLIHL